MFIFNLAVGFVVLILCADYVCCFFEHAQERKFDPISLLFALALFAAGMFAFGVLK